MKNTIQKDNKHWIKGSLVGEDGNIFSIMGRCTKALKKIGQNEQAKELTEKIFSDSSYDEALQICMQYVKVE